MKKIVYIAILTAFLFSNIGYSYLLFLEQESQQMNMNEKIQNISPKDLVTLTFNPAQKKDIKWKNDHELNYNGELYDVAKVIDEGSGVVKFLCYADGKEKSILNMLDGLVKSNHGGSGKTKSLVKNMCKDFVQNMIEIIPSVSFAETCFTEKVIPLSSFSQELIIPPPNC